MPTIFTGSALRVSAHGIVKYLARQIPAIPATLAAVALMWGLHLAATMNGTHALTAFGLRQSMPLGDIHIVTSLLTASSSLGLVTATLAALVLAAPAERVLGTWRFVLSALVTSIPAVVVAGITSDLCDVSVHWNWATHLHSETFLSPLPWMIGAACVASGAYPLVWQRRIRILTLTLTTTLVLFSGSIADLAGFYAAGLGIVIGAAQLGGKAYRHFSLHPRAMSLRESRIVVAMAALGVAAGPVLVAASPTSKGPFAAVTALLWTAPIDVADVQALCAANPNARDCTLALHMLHFSGLGPWVANILPFIVTMVAAFGLIRGRRLAWMTLLILQLIAVVFVLFSITELAYQSSSLWAQAMWTLGIVTPWLLILAVLITTRRLFFVPTSGDAILRFLSKAGIWTTALCIVWLAVTQVLEDNFVVIASQSVIGEPPEGWSSLTAALIDVPGRLVPPALALAFPDMLLPTTSAAWLVYEWLSVVMWGGIAFFLWQVFASTSLPERESERELARDILQHGTGDHLSWMTLWEGNRYWFATNEAGYVAYRLVNNVVVTLGEPVLSLSAEEQGATASMLADEFESFAERMGWTVAWYSVRREFALTREKTGHKKVHVAAESVLLTENSEFTGKKFQNIRTARNRAGKEGIATVWSRWNDLEPELQQGVIALSEQWVADKALPEMGFTLGTVEELADPNTMLLLAVDESKRVHGITSWLPVYEQGELTGYTLDFMRRDRDGFRPVIEFLLAEAVVIAKTNGCQWVSLSGAPLAPPAQSSEDTTEAGTLDVLLDRAGGALEPLYGFRSLAASKYKFHPEHHSWFMCYNDELALPRIGIAVARSYLPHLSVKDGIEVIREWSRSHAARA
ncbi:MAG: DUF2156 domain-containing protein [Corynebacterium sp.]|nr:DUF2156 domain-containing protein [Corynebacterium sp.]